MTIHDLRTALDVFRHAGEVYEIRQEVDPVRELGAVLRACEKADKAGYFHHVKGYEVPVVGGVLSSPKLVALALGCATSEVGDRMAMATEHPVPPAAFEGPAPCQDIVIKPPLDLMRWPIPTHSPLDAGPFITAGVVIARDPDGGRHNLSYNRMQVYGPERAGVNMNIWRHVKHFFDTIERQGRNLPFCVAIGLDPAVMIAAAFRYPGDEYEIAGALRGAPIPVARAVTSDVLVPAYSELVLECELVAAEREIEGPMAEFTGHYSGAGPKHVARVNLITHRPNPIFQTMNGGGYEHVSLGNMLTREPLLARFIRHLTRKLKAVHLPPYAAGFTALVSLDGPDPGEARNVAIAAMAAHVNIKTVILVDADVDVYDPADVMWALSTRVRWDRDLIPIPEAQGNELDPTADEHGVQCKLIIDATLPVEARSRYVKVNYPAVDLASYLEPGPGVRDGRR